MTTTLLRRWATGAACCNLCLAGVWLAGCASQPTREPAPADPASESSEGPNAQPDPAMETIAGSDADRAIQAIESRPPPPPPESREPYRPPTHRPVDQPRVGPR